MTSGGTSGFKTAARSRCRSGGTHACCAPPPGQRSSWEILPFGDALRRPDLDEDLDVHGFLIGAKARGAKPPVEA